MFRFLIADDHPVVRKGVQVILSASFPSAYIVEVTNGDDLDKRATGEPWDVIISDISMPGRNVLEVLAEVKAASPRLPFLILSMHAEDQYALRAIKAGASGYLNKESAGEELVNAVHRILSGKMYITTSIAEKLIAGVHRDQEFMPHEYLSNREFQVLKLLATGTSVSDIANQLFLRGSTVSTYRSRILEKMNLKSTAELVKYAIGHQLL